jgi:hypothetical protein
MSRKVKRKRGRKVKRENLSPIGARTNAVPDNSSIAYGSSNVAHGSPNTASGYSNYSSYTDNGDGCLIDLPPIQIPQDTQENGPSIEEKYKKLRTMPIVHFNFDEFELIVNAKSPYGSVVYASQHVKEQIDKLYKKLTSNEMVA